MSTNKITTKILLKSDPVLGPTPKEKLSDAVGEIESLAYARGLRDALVRFEGIAAIIPNKRLTSDRVIEMVRNEIEAAVKQWEENK